MSPFAIYLRRLREPRRLPQKAAAARLGCKQSYLSSLENGRKKVPRDQFLQRVIDAYCLSDEEAAELRRVAELSCGAIRLPDVTRPEEYAICQKLQDHLGRLTETQIRLIEIALDLREVSESCLSLRPSRRREEKEASM